MTSRIGIVGGGGNLLAEEVVLLLGKLVHGGAVVVPEVRRELGINVIRSTIRRVEIKRIEPYFWSWQIVAAPGVGVGGCRDGGGRHCRGAKSRWRPVALLLFHRQVERRFWTGRQDFRC